MRRCAAAKPATSSKSTRTPGVRSRRSRRGCRRPASPPPGARPPSPRTVRCPCDSSWECSTKALCAAPAPREPRSRDRCVRADRHAILDARTGRQGHSVRRDGPPRSSEPMISSRASGTLLERRSGEGGDGAVVAFPRMDDADRQHQRRRAAARPRARRRIRRGIDSLRAGRRGSDRGVAPRWRAPRSSCRRSDQVAQSFSCSPLAAGMEQECRSRGLERQPPLAPARRSSLLLDDAVQRPHQRQPAAPGRRRVTASSNRPEPCRCTTAPGALSQHADHHRHAGDRRDGGDLQTVGRGRARSSRSRAIRRRARCRRRRFLGVATTLQAGRCRGSGRRDAVTRP